MTFYEDSIAKAPPFFCLSEALQEEAPSLALTPPSPLRSKALCDKAAQHTASRMNALPFLPGRHNLPEQDQVFPSPFAPARCLRCGPQW